MIAILIVYKRHQRHLTEELLEDWEVTKHRRKALKAGRKLVPSSGKSASDPSWTRPHRRRYQVCSSSEDTTPLKDLEKPSSEAPRSSERHYLFSPVLKREAIYVEVSQHSSFPREDYPEFSFAVVTPPAHQNGSKVQGSKQEKRLSARQERPQTVNLISSSETAESSAKGINKQPQKNCTWNQSPYQSQRADLLQSSKSETSNFKSAATNPQNSSSSLAFLTQVPLNYRFQGSSSCRADSDISILAQRDPNSQTQRSDQASGTSSGETLKFRKSFQFPRVRSPEQQGPRNGSKVTRPFSASMSEPFQPTIDAILSEPPRRPPSTETNAFRSPLSPIAAGLRADFEAGNPSPPATVSSLRARIEAAATGQGGRSPAAIPEPIIHHPPGDSRLEPQIPDMPIPRSINTHIGDPTGRTAVTIIDMPARPANSQMSPHAPRNPSKLSSPPQTAEIDIITQLPTPKMKPDELIVPLPLFSRIQEQYMSTIGHYQNATRNILSLVTPDEDSIREVEEMMMRLNRITNHVDLDDPTTDWNEELSMEEESRWAVQNSSKFAFLNHLISRLGKESIHLAIVAESGRLLDILARFLCAQKAAKVSILNTGAIVNHHIMTDLRISLLPSGRFEPRAEVAPASLVLAFDSSFDAEVPAIRALRYNPSGRLSPIIYLMVHSSVEHLKLCAPPMKNPLDSLRVMTQCVIQTRAEVGELLPEDYSALPAAEEVAHFICNGCNPNFWSLLNPRSINLKGLELLVASQETPPLTADGESSRRKRQIVRFDLKSPSRRANSVSRIL